MYKDIDVFVAGGGPAGLAAAIAAAQHGLSVAVADGAEPPIDKPCGEGLMPETLAALRDLGVNVPLAAGRNFRGLRFVQGGREVSADFTSGHGIGMRRPVLHALLIDAAQKCGVQFLWKTAVTGIEARGVRLMNGFAPARWIIGADGGASRIRKWAGLDSPVRRTQRIASRRHYRIRPWSEYMEIHWGRSTQAYVTPVAAEQTCVAILGDDTEDAKFDRAFAELPVLRERLNGAELASRERGAVTVMQRFSRVSRGNVALIGDASGGVDAITGDGLRLAFRQAAALADAMQSNDLRGYERAHRELQRRPFLMGKLLVELGRRKFVRDRVLRAFSARPELFQRLLAIHGGVVSPREILAAGAQLGWQFVTA